MDKETLILKTKCTDKDGNIGTFLIGEKKQISKATFKII